MFQLKSIFALGMILSLILGATAQTKQPKTARDFFMLVPTKFYIFQCCNDNKKAYLKQYATAKKLNFLQGTDEGINEFTLAVTLLCVKTHG